MGKKIKLLGLMLFLIHPVLLSAFIPHPITPNPVLGFQDIPFFDEFQKTERHLLVWYPVDASVQGQPSKDPWDLFFVAPNVPPALSEVKMPIIILSHGYTGNPHQLSWLIRSLVYEGFFVVGMQHRDLIEGKVHINHWKRAIDVKEMIDRFSSSSLALSADLKKIGIAGYSLGGTTAIWVAGARSTKLQSLIPGPEFASPEEFSGADEALSTLDKEKMGGNWHEDRIKAAFVMAPAWAWIFNEASLQRISIPVYLIASSADQVLVSKNNAGFFARHIPHAFYQEIPGKSGHYIFISALNEQQRQSADPAGKLTFLFEDQAHVDRRWVQFEVGEEAARFFRSIFDR